MQQLVSMIKMPGMPSLPGSISIVIIKGLGSIAQQRPQYLGRILPTLLSLASNVKQPQVPSSVVSPSVICEHPAIFSMEPLVTQHHSCLASGCIHTFAMCIMVALQLAAAYIPKTDVALDLKPPKTCFRSYLSGTMGYLM